MSENIIHISVINKLSHIDLIKMIKKDRGDQWYTLSSTVQKVGGPPPSSDTHESLLQ